MVAKGGQWGTWWGHDCPLVQSLFTYSCQGTAKPGKGPIDALEATGAPPVSTVCVCTFSSQKVVALGLNCALLLSC